MNQSPGRPSNVRFLVLLVTFLAAVLLYLHRYCASYMQQFIKEDLSLDNNLFGWCFTSFSIAYALAQVPSGMLSDRFGARSMLTIYILVWSAATALLGMATGFLTLLMFRIGMGVGQAGAYPTSAGLIKHWFPTSQRGKANSIVAMGGRIGAAIAPVLTALLVIALVPTSTSSLLKPQDLLDLPGLAGTWTAATSHGDTASAAAIGKQPDDTDVALGTVRRNWYALLSADVRSLLERLALDPRAAVTDAERERLVFQLNALLANPEFCDPELFRDIPQEREAKSLAHRPSLTPGQTERLNRLALEAVFPQSVRKVYGQGWRRVMFVYGGAGLLVAGLFWFVFRNRPAEHPRVNEAERDLIAAGSVTAAKPGSKGDAGFPWGAILSSRSLWLMCINQFGGTFSSTFLFTWLPRYLWEAHNVPYVERNFMASVPLFLGFGGMLLGGWATDYAVRRMGLRWRVAPAVAGRMLAAVACFSVWGLASAWGATAAFALIGFSNDMSNPCSWAYKQDVGGRYVSAIHGWANMWGNLGGALSPILLQAIVFRWGWDPAFLTMGVAYVIAGAAALGVDARIPIVAEDAVDAA